MTRIVAVTVVLAVLAAGRVAGAQVTLPNGITIAFDKLYIHEDGSKVAVEPQRDPDSLWEYFNFAHCQCGKEQPTFVEATYEYLLIASATSPVISDPLNIWVGAACSTDVTTRNTNCRAISGQNPSIAAIQAAANVRVVIPIYDAMNPEMARAGMDCPQRVQSATVWGLADSTIGSGLLDYSTSETITTDSSPPPLPTEVRALGSEGAILLSWTPPVDSSDVYGYQALCARAEDDAPGKSDPGIPARYMTPRSLCGSTSALSTVDLDANPINLPAPTDPDAGMPARVVLPPGLKTLDKGFLCGETLTSTASGMTIDGLENGVAYKVVLLAIDKYQNVRGTYFTSTITPQPVTDFWEQLHMQGSRAEGGLCLLAETYGDGSGLTQTLRAFRDHTLGGSRAGRWLGRAYYATLGELGAHVHGSSALRVIAAIGLAPLVAVALAWHWLTLPGLLAVIVLLVVARQRRGWLAGALTRVRPARAVGTPAIVVVIAVLAPGQARAGGYQPYWEDSERKDDDSGADADDSELVKWHAGVRVGPYLPGIDQQLGVSPGPYRRVFGTKRAVMPMLDVDRILWAGFGQLGIGGSIGYTQRTADSLKVKADPDEPDMRVPGASTTFRLLPLVVTATYRFTWLDDQYGIPFVPYVRAGLAYYIWWITAPNGSTSRVCKDGSASCPGNENKAFGASAGVQGSIGLAIRAERLDPSTANSMRQSGIHHAGIYGELSFANVNGFGSDTKLSVGDRTWFAGVDFEF
jgi:hypothetical protein